MKIFAAKTIKKEPVLAYRLSKLLDSTEQKTVRCPVLNNF